MKKVDSIYGLSIALFIILFWSGSLTYLLNVPPGEITLALAGVGILWQTFLYTGLFITAHDAMHLNVFSMDRRVDRALGAFCVGLYALFDYNSLREKHWDHHRHPASEDDPDFHDGEHAGFWSWYTHFMVGYITWKQLILITIAFNVLLHLFKIPIHNLILFWVIPPLLSTFQLFYFGTYLTHRETEHGYIDEHHARSNDFSPFWSFLSCYHFGYHWEHHEHPNVPWWRLPAYRRKIGNR